MPDRIATFLMGNPPNGIPNGQVGISSMYCKVEAFGSQYCSHLLGSCSDVRFLLKQACVSMKSVTVWGGLNRVAVAPSPEHCYCLSILGI